MKEDKKYLTLVFSADDAEALDKFLEPWKKKLGKKSEGIHLGVISLSDMASERDWLEDLLVELESYYGGYCAYIDELDMELCLDEFIERRRKGADENAV